MHVEVIKKIKQLRIAKGLTPLQMSEKLNIDMSAYTRLEAGKTLTWAKYLEDLLQIFETTPDVFFEDIGKNIKITNSSGSYGGNVHVENLFADNKEKMEKIEFLYLERLKDKDLMIKELQNIIKNLNSLRD